ncbi:MAG TPA: cysteine peptidase family C39 domain-containing protein, partial [Bacilli bacterium]|nr:cysteine peptidase family C39 domain-containing protein [Bacilli bacterium]
MKYRIVFQDRVTDCGYASLAMILKYYGIKYNENDLKKRLKTNKDGTSAYNIIMASKYYGLKAEGYKVDINNLYNQKMPLIVHTIKNDLQHFIVIYNIDKTNNIITIADPSNGLIKLSITDFLNIWTGIILVFEYKKVINKPKSKDNKVLSKIIKSEKYNILLITIFSFIT